MGGLDSCNPDFMAEGFQHLGRRVQETSSYHGRLHRRLLEEHRQVSRRQCRQASISPANPAGVEAAKQGRERKQIFLS
ncbi:hypothetical protein EJ110_NYTH58735 [Nymphaea thermarum]|nr:hypothetical protein EJ110_NYTH58735 [Nymphaea thermarum]